MKLLKLVWHVTIITFALYVVRPIEALYFSTSEAYSAFIENKYFTDEEVENVIEGFLWSNVDEGGELMEEDPVKWWRWYVREVVLDD